MSAAIQSPDSMWSVRPVPAKSIPACADVIRKSFLTIAEAFGWTKENAPGFTAFAVTTEKLLEQTEQGRRSLYALFKEERQIAGCYALSFPGRGVCEMSYLCVLPEFRHNGMGETLLRSAEKQAAVHGCSCIRIGIVEENQVLKRWYEKNGFLHTGTKQYGFLPFTCGYMEKKIENTAHP